MRIESFASRGVRVLAFLGKLELGSGDEELIRAFDGEVAAGARFLVLDLHDLKWIDSAGIGAVVRCAKHAAEKGAVLKIVLDAGGPVRKMFAATQLDRAFEVFDDAASAVGSFPA